MEFWMPVKTKASVAVFAFDQQGRILLVQSTKNKESRGWCIPCESPKRTDKTAIDTAIRALVEESGGAIGPQQIEITHASTTYGAICAAFINREQGSKVILGIRAFIKDADKLELKPTKEISQQGWFPLLRSPGQAQSCWDVLTSDLAKDRLLTYLDAQTAHASLTLEFDYKPPTAKRTGAPYIGIRQRLLRREDIEDLAPKFLEGVIGNSCNLTPKSNVSILRA